MSEFYDGLTTSPITDGLTSEERAELHRNESLSRGFGRAIGGIYDNHPFTQLFRQYLGGQEGQTRNQSEPIQPMFDEDGNFTLFKEQSGGYSMNQDVNTSSLTPADIGGITASAVPGGTSYGTGQFVPQGSGTSYRTGQFVPQGGYTMNQDNTSEQLREIDPEVAELMGNPDYRAAVEENKKLKALVNLLGFAEGLTGQGDTNTNVQMLKELDPSLENLSQLEQLLKQNEHLNNQLKSVFRNQDGYTVNRDAGLENKLLTPKQQTLPDNLKEAIIESKMKNEGGVNKAMAGMVVPPDPRIMTNRFIDGTDINRPIDYNTMDASLLGQEQRMANAFNNANIPNGGTVMAADGMRQEDMAVNNAIQQYRNEMYLKNGGMMTRGMDAFSPPVPMGPSNLSQSLVNTGGEMTGTSSAQQAIDASLAAMAAPNILSPGNYTTIQGKFPGNEIVKPTSQFIGEAKQFYI